MEITLQQSLESFPGIGPARMTALQRLGLQTVEQLLQYYPRDYEDRTEVPSIQAAPLEEPVCFRAVVAEPFQTSYVRRGMEVTKGVVADHTGKVYVTFFNQTYVRRALQPGEEYLFYGKLTGFGARRQVSNPQFERAGEGNYTGGILPVYPLTSGISNHLLVGLARQAMACAGDLAECLQPDILRQYQLAQAEFSCRNIHFPASWEALQLARRRLMFEELFCLTLGLHLLRGRRDGARGWKLPRGDRDAFLSLLSYALTDAQGKAMDQIEEDMTSGGAMNRLLQGDVGSGKTTVAAYGAWLAWKGGGQTALMVPTELLARQHVATLTRMLAPGGMRVGLLTGSLTAAEKRKIRQQIADGQLDLVVGTHALLTQEVSFSKLALVVADEQHRFGVEQRAALLAKGEAGLRPHVLVMSATPIPRTLALMVYGDLDVSVIDQLPPGRKPVKTFVIGEDKRQRLYGFIRKQVQEGRQVYLVCPAVEGEDPEGVKAAEQVGDTLQKEVFPDLRLSVVHGRKKPKEKEAIMTAFAAGEVDILVATTVIEVGVDVPNASLMVVENAERFGLSQLHQLRGRVGRGAWESFCILLTDNRGETARERLKVLAKTTDGFQIAEEDLRLRGPGDFFGARQHGLPQLKLADLAGDMRLLSQAQEAARVLLRSDPRLEEPVNAGLRRRVARLFSENRDISN